MILTMDGGTTNTRIHLVEGETVRDRIKLPIGAGSAAQTGSNQQLKEAIAQGIDTLLQRNGLSWQEIERVVGSGMLTSELGLCDIPHKSMPAGEDDLARGMVTVVLPDVCKRPIRLIPGLKNPPSDDLFQADIMRGEETELVGLMALTKIRPPFTAVLPGTHTKLIRVDETGQMQFCRTTLGGELLAAIPQNTVLKSSVTVPLLQEGADLSYLQKGMACSRSLGMSSAAFKARVLVNSYGVSAADAGAFLAGVILEPDLAAIRQVAGTDPILLGGSRPLKDAFAQLIRAQMENELIVADEEQVDHSTVCGALEILRAAKE